jgi:hypothetical protein
MTRWINEQELQLITNIDDIQNESTYIIRQEHYVTGAVYYTKLEAYERTRVSFRLAGTLYKTYSKKPKKIKNSNVYKDIGFDKYFEYRRYLALLANFDFAKLDDHKIKVIRDLIYS